MVTGADMDARAEIRALRLRVAAGRRRAARAASLAVRHETQAALVGGSLRALHTRMADLYRQIEARHLAAVRVTELYANRMERWLDGGYGQASRPVFMAAVASALGTPSAAATLRGQRHASVVAAASDATARAAHELELVMSEGPAADAAAAGTSIAVAGTALLDRWPHYGPAVAELGVRAVTAAPLGPPGARLGALCGYAAEPVLRDGSAAATDRMAVALTQLLLLDVDIQGSGHGGPVLRVFGGDGYPAIIHQAAGMVSVQCDCGVDDAEDLLVARAFSTSTPVEQIAVQVVRGEISFC
jgi:hypothetical protein